MPLDVQAVAILDEDKEFPVINGTSEDSWRINDGKYNLPKEFSFFGIGRAGKKNGNQQEKD